jgi:hypothetical protein
VPAVTIANTPCANRNEQPARQSVQRAIGRRIPQQQADNLGISANTAAPKQRLQTGRRQ